MATGHGLVFGVEHDWTFTDWSQILYDATLQGTPPHPNTTDFAAYDINWIVSVRGRLGKPIRDQRALLYATAGLAWARAEYGACNCNNFSRPPVYGSVRFDSLGFVGGGGMEFRVTDRFSLRGEALYHYWGDIKDTGELNSDSDTGDFAKLVDSLQLRLGASIHY